jgi:hypothetical protein
MERAWIIISGLCLVAAAAFMWRSHLDAAFVAAVLGCVAWFLGLRTRLRKTIITAEEHEIDVESTDAGDQDEV